jgi:hypothetical protein
VPSYVLTSRSADALRLNKAVRPCDRLYAAYDDAYWTPVVDPPGVAPTPDRTEHVAPDPSRTTNTPGILRLLPEPASSPALLQQYQYPNFPHNPNNVFDNTLPRGLFYLVIDHFFDYLHALNPVVHRPTLLRDILDRREENTGQEEWVAMVLAVVGLTILQLPPSFVPIPVTESRRIAYACYRHARGYSLTDYEHTSVDRRE